jgi:acetolactate synthase-1/2/3 large subunit
MFTPDFVKLGEAYGIPAFSVTSQEQALEAIAAARAEAGPVIIEFKVAAEENCYPMIPSGMTVNDMMEEPLREEDLVWARRSTR